MDKLKDSNESDRRERTPDASRESNKCSSLCCIQFCKNYFWEGQTLSASQAHKMKMDLDVLHTLPLHRRILIRYRRILAPVIPIVVVYFFWTSLMIVNNKWYLFLANYYMSITMIFGSLLAGMTSVGGGAVAFPVMTLAFSIDPSDARDFTLIIQSLGMSAASFAIFFMKVKIEWVSLIICSIGGILGFIMGIHGVDPYLAASQKKIIFVSFWGAFASVLVFINRRRNRQTYLHIHNMAAWKGIVLLLTGVIGGMFTSFSGSGLDICTFSVLTLLFRVSEKVATPTSVILMACNSLVGLYWQGVVLHDIGQQAWNFVVVCVPVVVVGAPMGAFLGSYFHRLVLAAIVVIANAAGLIGAYAILDMTTQLIIISVSTLIGGIAIFGILSYGGYRMMRGYTKDSDTSPRTACSSEHQGHKSNTPSSKLIANINATVLPITSNPSPLIENNTNEVVIRF